MTTSDDAVTVERRSRKLSALLRAADEVPRAIEFPVRRIEVARHGRLRMITWRWRAVAAALVLMAVAMAVEPVRAWITGAARSLMHRLASESRPEPTSPVPEPVAVSQPANRVTFTPPPDIFVLEVSSRQAAGQLTITPGAGSSAVAEVAGDPADAELVVMPGGLRIINRASSSSQYTVRVPSTLGRVVVRVGREQAVLFTPAPDARPLILDLGRIR